ncbi:MAG: hypothetical protein BAA01_05110 [Bacillus thermozeamaize]|uniref:Uncharacterized protein n=1 Tax=Bacillus thermozeamaize TaxID=230954 RepID=A0A1Y3PE07_9BACI|nr:MAG: hypothetical protein BAA01_05110 [Bacillus thermozeamaize]
MQPFPGKARDCFRWVRRLGLTVLFLGLMFSGAIWAKQETPVEGKVPDEGKVQDGGRMPGNRRVILVLMNGLSFGDLLAHPAWRELAGESWLGAMTLKTARTHKDVHAYVTLGAGAYAAGVKEAHGYDAQEQVPPEGVRASKWYAQLTGRWQTSGVLVPAIARLVSENQAMKQYVAVPGALGQLIRESGGWTAVFGNSDRGPAVKRLAPLLTMDEAGWTPLGEVGRRMVREAPERPFGMATDYDAMMQAFRTLPFAVRLVVFELGDLDRLSALVGQMDSRHAVYVRTVILNEMARFVQGVRREKRDEDTLLVVSPMVDESSYQAGMWLAPVLWLEGKTKGGTGRQPGGLLRSESTRRDGVVTNLDVTATVLQQLGIPIPLWMSGCALQKAGTASEQDAFWRELGQMHWAHQMRPRVLRPYVVQQMAIFILAGLVGLFHFQKWYARVRILAFATLFAPLAFFVLSDWLAAGWQALLFLWGVTLLAAWLIDRWFPPPVGLLLAAGCGWLPVALDLLRGGVWLRESLLSYDPMLAARFYGIGNEYMGILVGSVILTVALVWDLLHASGRTWRNRLLLAGTACFMLGWVIVLSDPGTGANAGGALAAGVGFTGAWIFLRQPNASIRRILLLLAVGFFFAFLLLLGINTFGTGVQDSHVGMALEVSNEGEWEAIRALIVRKLETNWRLIRYSIWTKVFATSLLVSLLVQLRPRMGGKGRLQRFSPQLAAGFRGILVGSVAALFFNDSGIVAAATAIVYLVVPMIVLSLASADIRLENASVQTDARGA